MKANLLLSGLLLLSLHSSITIAQPSSSYEFTHKTEPYVYLTGGNNMLASFADTIHLGFDIRIGSAVNDTIYVSKNGSISTSGLDTSHPMFYAFGAEHSQGQYLYKVDTVKGNRIVKLQFQNVRFDHDFTGLDYANFQVWIYEEDRTIEVRFGNSSVINVDWSYYFAKGGAAVGIRNFWLKGPVDSPVTDTGTAVVRVTGTPDSGQVYRFTLGSPFQSSVATLAGDQYVSVYPNPSSGSFYINTTRPSQVIRAVIVQDILGRTVYSAGPQPSGALLKTGLPAGMYTLNVVIDEKNVALRLLVQ